jgi:hypothetical protein
MVPATSTIKKMGLGNADAEKCSGLGLVESFLAKDTCPYLHDKYANRGWADHLLYCVCNCSYCEESRLRQRYGLPRSRDPPTR